MVSEGLADASCKSNVRFGGYRRICVVNPRTQLG